MFDFSVIPTMLGSALRPIVDLFFDSKTFYRQHVEPTVQAVKAGDTGTIIGVVLLVLAIVAVLVIVGRKEPHRKFLVALKRKPQNIPLAVLAIAFLVYTLNLSVVSRTNETVQQGTGLTGFITILASTLLLVCCLNAFPYRKKPNIFMMVLMYVLIVGVMVCDCRYYAVVTNSLATHNYTDTSFILAARGVVCTHFLVLLLGILAAAFLPLYAMLIRKMNTSIDVEGNEDMAAIDITGE